MKAYEVERGEYFQLVEDEDRITFRMDRVDGLWCNVTACGSGRVLKVHAMEDVIPCN